MHNGRKFICAANWKMNKAPEESRVFLESFLPLVQGIKHPTLEIVIFPPSIDIPEVNERTRGSKILWGAQNCYSQVSGAYTGETSPEVVKKIGGTYMLIGHSERRKIFRETDEELNAKIKMAHKIALVPMLCIGEELTDRESGKTLEVVKNQLQKDLAGVDFTLPLQIAYEPVWAIGTGKVATPEQVAETHAQVREILVSLAGKTKAEATSILYGGSAKADNAGGLAQIKDVDGFLVGGASLEAKSFSDLIRAALG